MERHPGMPLARRFCGLDFKIHDNRVLPVSNHHCFANLVRAGVDLLMRDDPELLCSIPGDLPIAFVRGPTIYSTVSNSSDPSTGDSSRVVRDRTVISAFFPTHNIDDLPDLIAKTNFH